GSVSGSQGEGGPATDAVLMPSDLAVDTNGDLYVLDRSSARVRKIGPDGIIKTVAGGGNDLYPDLAAIGYGGGGPATLAVLNDPFRIHLDSQGSLYILEHNGIDPDRLRKVGPDGIISTLADTSVPWDPLDATGNRYFVDPTRGPNKVFKEEGE